MRKVEYSLYMVTDRTLMRTQDLEECVGQALAGGVTLVQLREKDLDTDAFIALGKRIKSICEAYAVPLVINDRLDVALSGWMLVGCISAKMTCPHPLPVPCWALSACWASR